MDSIKDRDKLFRKYTKANYIWIMKTTEMLEIRQESLSNLKKYFFMKKQSIKTQGTQKNMGHT